MSSRIAFTDAHGISCVRLSLAGGASALLSLLGAQVLSWTTADGIEHLFLSDTARFDGTVAIRGGIPVCFPQFAGLGALPKHGLVRTRPWRLVGQSVGADRASVLLEIREDAETLSIWPHRFTARLDVELTDRQLVVRLDVVNTGDVPLSFTAALHSYLRVGDIGAVRVAGLEGLEYRDAAHGNVIRTETEPALHIDAEVDRVYHHVVEPLRLTEGDSALVVGNGGFDDVVVWNPWALLGAKFADMAPDDYRSMLCIEAAAARDPVVVRGGASWTGRQILIAVEKT